MEENRKSTFTVKAMVHSLKALDDVRIISHTDNNNVIAEYHGIKCTAVFNPFAGLYYVDDVYGIIEDDIISREAVPESEKPEITMTANKPVKKRQVYTMSELNLCMMKMFNSFNADFFGGELPKVIITFEGGFKKGAFGWICTQKTWKQGNEEKYAINISSDYLDRDVYSIMATLLHEMCHLYALEKGIQDTSRSGIYHNKKFKQIAENHGLNVSEADTIGWSITTLIDDTRAYVDRICPIKSFRLMQKKPSEKSGTSPKAKQSRRKYICPKCGTQITATKEVSVICGACFEVGEEPVYMELET